jgi:hypothetical protein
MDRDSERLFVGASPMNESDKRNQNRFAFPVGRMECMNEICPRFRTMARWWTWLLALRQKSLSFERGCLPAMQMRERISVLADASL